jgi:hypothetical protein
MARPRSIKPDELNMLTLFKVLIIKFKEHNPDSGVSKAESCQNNRHY